MCLVAFNWSSHPDYKLVLVANRDEFYQRPSSPLHLWEEGFYAGRDLRGGGTWMGIHPNGRFAALTNYRDVSNEKEVASSRGELVVDFLKGDMTAVGYLEALQRKKANYSGFSLLISDGNNMYYLSNYQENIQEVVPGYHGLSNALLDTPWYKVETAKNELSSYLQGIQTPEIDGLTDLFKSTTTAQQEMLPATGLSPELEKAVSAQFISVGDHYGTVNTTALLWSKEGEVTMKEVRFIPDKEENAVQFLVKYS